MKRTVASEGAVEGNKDIFAVIRSQMPDMTPNQRRLAEYTLRDQQVVAFSTINELADVTGVSPATIVRFAKSLGFEGYHGFQGEIRRVARLNLGGPERFRGGHKSKSKRGNIFSPVTNKELENISALQDYNSESIVSDAVKLLSNASKVVVVGSRSSASLANYFWFALGKTGVSAERALVVDSYTHEMIDRLDSNGCVVVIGFARYLKELDRCIEFVKSSGKRLIVITDSLFSPFKGDITLYAPVESASFVAFHCAPLVLMATLLNEIANDQPERTLKTLDWFENLASRQDLFMRTQLEKNEVQGTGRVKL